jgi:hypothetical protein
MICQRFGLKTDGDGFLWFDFKTSDDGFLRFGLKISGDSFSRFDLKNRWWVSWLSLKTKVMEGFPVWASKSSRRFLNLGLKTKQTSVCQLRHKTDGGSSAWDTCRDLAACFAWKQAGLAFSSLASRLAEVQRRVMHVVISWRLHQSQVEDGRVDATGCIGSFYPTFTVFIVLCPRGSLVI